MKSGIDQMTKVLAIAGAFVALGCGGGMPESEKGKEWIHQGYAQGTTYTIKYIAPDSVPQAKIDAALEEVDIEMNAWRAVSVQRVFPYRHCL